MILVEGSAKAVKFYKRVMLVRIDWTEEARARNADGEEEEDDESNGAGGGEEQQSLADNRCDLVWEGPIKERGFNIFRAKNVETEKIARDFLGEKNQGFWDVSATFPFFRFSLVAFASGRAKSKLTLHSLFLIPFAVQVAAKFNPEDA